jgi:hypothetical protein
MKESQSTGLFSHLRRECNDRNPHAAGLVKLSVSSIEGSKFNGENVLDWGPSNCWASKKGPNHWIDFDLLGKSFILTGLSIYTLSGHFAQKWKLLGLNNDEQWVTIYESNNDDRLNTKTNTVVNLEIQNTTAFNRFRIVSHSDTFDGTNQFSMNSIEFYGSLLYFH